MHNYLKRQILSQKNPYAFILVIGSLFVIITLLLIGYQKNKTTAQDLDVLQKTKVMHQAIALNN